jgi:hypothetical protein
MLSALLNGGRAEPFGIDGALAISLFAGRVRLAALQIHAASQGRVTPPPSGLPRLGRGPSACDEQHQKHAAS